MALFHCLREYSPRSRLIMAIDNHPRIRRKQKLERKKATKKTGERILIVTEGSKTEPKYFTEIRQELRLSSTNIAVIHTQTCPLGLVKDAYDIAINGDIKNKIAPRAFEAIYIVFDRDEHLRYYNALSFLSSLQRKTFKNDENKKMRFESAVSVPSFELWFLIHFVDQFSPIDRSEVLEKLKQQEGFSNYMKGGGGYYGKTKSEIGPAFERAEVLCNKTDEFDGTEAYTGVHSLVKELLSLKR
jgi:hypothetical protein